MWSGNALQNVDTKNACAHPVTDLGPDHMTKSVDLRRATKEIGLKYRVDLGYNGDWILDFW